MGSNPLVSTTSNSHVMSNEPKRPNSVSVEWNRDGLPHNVAMTEADHIGSLDVYIHQARDVNNICIYHKQDVYAKVCLTSDPEHSVSTKIINGGGRNPVFNENLQLNVRTIDSTLKCEIWMLSRVRNYLEDQLLGFALVPLAEVVAAENAKLSQDFSLSSTDLFHSPAGFVQLSLSYVGSSPDVMAIPSPQSSVITTSQQTDPIPCEFVKLEFPDLKVVNENRQMLSEYIGIPQDNLETDCVDNLVNEENGDCIDSDAGIRIVESFSTGNADKNEELKKETTDRFSHAPAPTVSQSSSDTSGVTESPELNDKPPENEGSSEQNSSERNKNSNAFTQPLIKINMEPEQTVVQQDIVNMYMKSMQQFTESLSKMRLPMDVESNSENSTTSADSGMDNKSQTPSSKETKPRVFYGSRAFF